MNKLSVLIGLFIVILVAAAVLILLPANKANAPVIGDGDIGLPAQADNAIEKQDLIRATTPQPGSQITSPLTVSGEARGTWYFEASFPIEIQDAQGNVIGQGYAQAQGEWMTTDFVAFQSIPITFTAEPTGSAGTLVLKKDNPSGLPENEDQLLIPVVF